METPQTGYQVKTYNVPVKRYCQTLDLRDSPELIAEYRKDTARQKFGPKSLQESMKLVSLRWKFTFSAPVCS